MYLLLLEAHFDVMSAAKGGLQEGHVGISWNPSGSHMTWKTPRSWWLFLLLLPVAILGKEGWLGQKGRHTVLSTSGNEA